MRKLETVWPAFHNNGGSFPTEFEEGVWKCPLCSQCTPRIQQHLARHKDLIEDWAAAEVYCKEVAVVKRRDADRKRAEDPRRKEVMKKYEQTDGGKERKRKYAQTDGGKKTEREAMRT